MGKQPPGEEKPQVGRHFSYQPTPHFRKRLEKIRGEDPPGYERIAGVIERLLENPAEADGALHGKYRGKLKKYVGRADYRLVYAWCEACRKANLHLVDACPLCGAIPEHSVVFFDVFHKSESRDLGY